VVGRHARGDVDRSRQDDDSQRAREQEHERPERIADAQLGEAAEGRKGLEHHLLERDGGPDDEQPEGGLRQPEVVHDPLRPEHQELGAEHQARQAAEDPQHEARRTARALGWHLGRGRRRAPEDDRGDERRERGDQHRAVPPAQRAVRGHGDADARRDAAGGQERRRRPDGEGRDEPGDAQAGGHQEDRRAHRGPERRARQVVERGGDARGGRLDVQSQHERPEQDSRQSGGGGPVPQGLHESLDRLDEEPYPCGEGGEGDGGAHDGGGGSRPLADGTAARA
jgi:hypothetical protein